MRAIRRINNNAAICEDGKGRQLVALGRGIGFGELPREVPLADVRRTFYGIDPKYLPLIEELDPEVLEFAAQLAEVARTSISSELSPNLPITLADHIEFALKRTREHMVVQMPLAYDVEHSYPVQYRLGEAAVNGINRTFHVHMPKSEAVGIALSIANSAVSASDRTSRDEGRRQRMVDRATKVVERQFGVSVARDSFDYARFATHIRYLLDRVEKGEPLDTHNSELYPVLSEQFPLATACAQEIARLIGDSYGSELTQEEVVYLILHVNRIAAREGASEGPADAV